MWALAWAVALARVYVGAHLPLDIVGGAAAGWAIGSLVHWVFGVPRWTPPVDRVGAMLRRFGLPVRDLRPAAVEARSSHPFEAVDERGRRVYVKALDPDRFERDWLYRLYRLAAVRDVKDADAVAPLGQQAEHEAVAAMTARERGVRVPPVVLARGHRPRRRGRAGVRDRPAARPAAPRRGDRRRCWPRSGARWALLRAARVAHHDLVASSVLVDADGRPWIVDFGNALTGADDDDDRRRRRRAHGLAGAAPRAAAGGRPRPSRRSGPDVVAAALPDLVPLTLSAATRTGMRERHGRLGALRGEIRRQLDLPDPDRPGFAPAGVARTGRGGRRRPAGARRSAAARPARPRWPTRWRSTAGAGSAAQSRWPSWPGARWRPRRC